MNTEEKPPLDTPFAWIGGEAAVRSLADRFYDLMDIEPGYKALRYHPRLRRWIGVRAADRVVLYLLRNVSGLAANISLGLLLGLVPVIAWFFGLNLDVRHVTLTAGQMAAAVFTLGLPALNTPAFGWALAGQAVIGPLNLGVSFYLAFRVAVASQNVSGINRSRIRRAIGQRIRSQPLSFVSPPKTQPVSV